MKKNYISPITEVIMLETGDLMEFTPSIPKNDGSGTSTGGPDAESKSFEMDSWSEVEFE